MQIWQIENSNLNSIFGALLPFDHSNLFRISDFVLRIFCSQPLRLCAFVGKTFLSLTRQRKGKGEAFPHFIVRTDLFSMQLDKLLGQG